MEDKRGYMRMGVSGALKLEFKIKKQGKLFDFSQARMTQIEDISAGGMCIEFSGVTQEEIENIKSGKDQLLLEMQVPSFKKPLIIPAKIAWLRKKDNQDAYLAGVSFTEIGEQEREQILSLLISLCLKGETK